jgi:hypothetical protein
VLRGFCDGELAWRAGQPRLGRAVPVGMDTAEQVWQGTHTWFFWTYALVDLVVFGGIALLSWGPAPERRRVRARRGPAKARRVVADQVRAPPGEHL